MCEGCYEERGRPAIVSIRTRSLAALLKGLDPFGNLHIIVSDWNLEDDNISFCARRVAGKQSRQIALDDGDTPTELERDAMMCEMFADFTVDERASALAIAEGWLAPD